MRSSRAWAIAAVLLLLIGAGVALALVLSSDGDDGGQSASDVDTESSSTTQTTFDLGLPGDVGSSTSTSTSLGTATTAAGGQGGVGGSSTTSSTVKPSTSTTKPEDTNDPACSARGTGAATADNQPMQVSFCLDDGSPKAGQAVKVSGTAVDPDAQIEPECIKVSWEGEQFGECTPLTVSESPVINRDFSFSHTFTKPGTYTIHVGAISDAPHGSFAEATLKITVHA
jgi:hypothetical protein